MAFIEPALCGGGGGADGEWVVGLMLHDIPHALWRGDSSSPWRRGPSAVHIAVHGAESETVPEKGGNMETGAEAASAADKDSSWSGAGTSPRKTVKETGKMHLIKYVVFSKRIRQQVAEGPYCSTAALLYQLQISAAGISPRASKIHFLTLNSQKNENAFKMYVCAFIGC